MTKVVVLGGTGFVGRQVCAQLLRAGCEVTVLTRRLDHAFHLLTQPLITVLQGDAFDGATLARALQGQDVVVNLVAILHGSAAAFERAHVQLPQTLVQACRASGVRRVVHVSALGAAAEAASLYQRSKARGETVLSSSGLDLTLLRPSVIFGPGDKFLNTFAQLQRVFPVIPLAGAEVRFQPVWVQDVARAVAVCVQNQHTIGQTFEACGPEVFSLRQLVQLAGQYAGVNGGRGRTIVALPDWLARVQATLMELAPGEPLMSRDNLKSMASDNVASGHVPGLQALGITPAALQAIAPLYLGRNGVPSRPVV